jgi:hypothetical protein
VEEGGEIQEGGEGNTRRVACKEAGRFPPQKGLSFISNRQRRKEGTFCASELAGIDPTPDRPKRAGYARLDLSATGGIPKPHRKSIDRRFVSAVRADESAVLARAITPSSFKVPLQEETRGS